MKLLNYKQSGSGADLVLIHGLFGSLDNLNMIAKELSQYFKVTNLDVRNHGDSFHENNMNYSDLARDIINLLDHLHIDKAHILGHSMGGKIAMEIALTFPERVIKLIVADISPVKYPAHHQQIIEGLKNIDLALVNNRRDADQQLSAYVDNIGVRQFLLRNLVKINTQYQFKCNLDFISQGYEQIMTGYTGNNKFTGETLFIKGGNSDYIKAEHRGVITKLFPKSKAKIIQGAGHWLHAEKTIAFNKTVKDFLSKIY